jgi:hypothetical protein
LVSFFDKATEQCGISVFISISLYDICRVVSASALSLWLWLH